MLYRKVNDERHDLSWSVEDFGGTTIAKLQTETMADQLIQVLEGSLKPRFAKSTNLNLYRIHVGYRSDEGGAQEVVEVHSALSRKRLEDAAIDCYYDERLDAAGCSPHCHAELLEEDDD
jgi:hypothetical protein